MRKQRGREAACAVAVGLIADSCWWWREIIAISNLSKKEEKNIGLHINNKHPTSILQKPPPLFLPAVFGRWHHRILVSFNNNNCH
jgi:hypothetical protein